MISDKENYFGLSEKEAQERLKIFGKNILWKKRGFDWLRFLKEETLNSFNILLFIVFLISFLGGGKKIESLLILGFLIISIILSLISELNFHRLYSKLEKFLQKKVLVKREGKEKFIFSENLVPDDIIYLSKGEKVPADGEILKCFNFLVNEQILTGESVPQQKKEKDLIFAGTEVLEGEALVKVKFTGKNTKFSKIGELAIQSPKKSAYQRELETFTKNIAKIALVFFILVLIVNFISKASILAKREILIFSLVLAISVIPEFFPPISTLTLAIFTQHFAKKKNIIKRLTAIEDLGVIDVLCVDKTGTLTTNELTLEKIDSLDPEKLLLFSFSLSKGISQRYLSDFKKALEEKISLKEREKLKDYILIERKLFDPILRMSQGIIKFKEKNFLVVLGAPENILEICKFKEEREREIWNEKLEKYSKEGFRVYALASKEIKEKKFIERGKKIFDFEFLGMTVFRDKVKESAKEAILKARELGIQIKILTGDRPEVAKKVALEIGLIQENEKILSEQELLNLTEREFERVIENSTVFARVNPETKFKIIQTLQKNHQVGYLGEGINDLPAIKAAQVSLVVDTAQDAAKELADVILLEKDLKVIVEGIVLGRKAFFNILKFLRHTMSDNFGNFFSVGFLSSFLSFLPLTPLQIIATDFATDLPLFALATDNVTEKETKKPGGYKIKEFFTLLIFLGIIAAFFNILAFLLFFDLTRESFTRTIIFFQTTLSGIFVFYSIRTNDWFFKSKPSLWMNFSIICALVVSFALIYFPFNKFFGLEKLPFSIVISLLFLNLIFLLISDLAKKIVLFYFRK